ncbi:MAG TPA: helix-turn-helix domain-containing protein [Conexibacter sp.]|nr:helix-turn-helix domain-containing protein [Conexibacter sp.]
MTTQTDEVVIAHLLDLGFTVYEARLYLTLLRNGPLIGNEAAKHATVPSSRVYAVLDKLARQGCVRSSPHGRSIWWSAVPPEELVARLRRDYNEPLDFLADALPRVHAAKPSEPFLTVAGLSAVHEAATTLISASQQELHVSCWPCDAEVLQRPLAAAHDRGVRVFGLLYGEADPPPGSWVHHQDGDVVAARVKGRMLALVVDDCEALIARANSWGYASAVRSRNPVLTLIVNQYLHHDSVMQRTRGSISA